MSFAPYKTQITKDAGANVVPANLVRSAETGGTVTADSAASAADDVTFVPSLYKSKAAMLAVLHALLKQADIVIDESFVTGEANEVRGARPKIAQLLVQAACGRLCVVISDV
jgi:hypothetical protein